MRSEPLPQPVLHGAASAKGSTTRTARPMALTDAQESETVSRSEAVLDEREEGPAMNLRSSGHHRGRMPRRGALDRSGVTDPRLDVVAELRRAAFYAETAALLARRAERCDSPALAAVLRDRAEVRRRTAERPLARLMHVVTVASPRDPQDGRRAEERL
jgi:hypothetical protein